MTEDQEKVKQQLSDKITKSSNFIFFIVDAWNGKKMFSTLFWKLYIPFQLILAITIFMSSQVFAHSGRTNSQGCHAGSKPYHCHDGNKQKSNNNYDNLDLSDFNNINQKQIIIIDGDTLKISGVRVRLYGIDASEYSQTCEVNNKIYSCGEESTIALKSMISNEVYCTIKGTDRYKRVLAVFYNETQNINYELVRNGFAIAYLQYSQDYKEQQIYARNNNLGIWKGSFIQPQDYRASKRR